MPTWAELPIDARASLGQIFVAGDRTKRVSWTESFYLPIDQQVSYFLFGGGGAFQDVGFPGNVQAFSMGGGPSSSLISGGNGMLAFSIGGGGALFGFNPTVDRPEFGFQQIYIASNPPAYWQRAYCVACTSISPNFPAGSLPIAVLVLDAIGKIQTLVDVRPSYLTSLPDLGTGMTEYVADPTLRVNLQNNFAVPRTYSLSRLIPGDLALPASGFTLGGGSVLLGGNVISTPATFISATTKVYRPEQQYAYFGALAQGLNQGFIDPGTGALAVRQTQTSGVFPAGSLPIFEATIDAGLIRNLVDCRPSYI